MKKMIQPGKIVAVCVSRRKGVRKKDIGRAYLKAGWGIPDDAHSGSWHRQISLLAEESMERLAASFPEGSERPSFRPGDFAENLTTRGMELHTIPVGTRLRVGEKVLLEVTQIGKECHLSCEIRKLVGDCVMPREGIFARVLEGGWVKSGQPLQVKSPENRAS